jgi:hypothetical protein
MQSSWRDPNREDAVTRQKRQLKNTIEFSEHDRSSIMARITPRWGKVIALVGGLFFGITLHWSVVQLPYIKKVDTYVAEATSQLETARLQIDTLRNENINIKETYQKQIFDLQSKVFFLCNTLDEISKNAVDYTTKIDKPRIAPPPDWCKSYKAKPAK